MKVSEENIEQSRETKSGGEKAETFKKCMDAASSAMNVLYKFAAGLGATTTFFYLLLIGFMPSGLTPGEVVFFAFIALAFAFTYILIIVYGAYASIWIAHSLSFIARLPKYSSRQLTAELFSGPSTNSTFADRYDVLSKPRQVWRNLRFAATRAAINDSTLVPPYARGVFPGLTSLAVFAFFATFAVDLRLTQFTEFLIGCVLAGLVVNMFLAIPKRATSSRQAMMSRLLGIGILPLALICIYVGPATPLNIAFNGLGIRAQDVSIEIPESELGAIERIQELVRRPLVDCRRPHADKFLVHGADVLWTGIGDQTLIQFGPGKATDRGLFAPRKTPVPNGSIKLETKTVRIIKTVPKLDPCFELPSDLLFEAEKQGLAPEGKERIRELSDAIVRLGTPKRIIVRGHTAPSRILVSADDSKTDDQRLSEQRAASIAAVFRQLFHGQKVDILSEGAGNREPRLKCPRDATTTPDDLEQCNKPNRRVEVRVTYGH